MNPEGPQSNDQVPDKQPLNQEALEPVFQPNTGSVGVATESNFQQAPAQPLVPGQKPSKKKLAVLLGVIGGIIVVLAGVFIFIAATSVSKADYREAAVQINATSKANSKFNSAMSAVGSTSGSASDNVFEDSVKTAKSAIASVRAENESLGELKAVRVGEGKQLYATFDEKLKLHLANSADMVTSFEKIRPASVACRSVSSAPDKGAQVAAMKKCAADFSKISDIPQKDVAAYVESVKKLYVTLAEVYEGVAGITDPYGKQNKEFRALREQSSEVQSKLLKSSREFTDIIKKLDQGAGLKAAATELGDYLEAGQK